MPNEISVAIPPKRAMLFLVAVTGSPKADPQIVTEINFTLKAKDGSIIQQCDPFFGNPVDQPTSDSDSTFRYNETDQEQSMTIGFKRRDEPPEQFEIKSQRLNGQVTAIGFQTRAGNQHLAFVFACVWGKK